jgi:hypothetical protein
MAGGDSDLWVVEYNGTDQWNKPPHTVGVA